MKHGRGKYVWNDGSCYDGEWFENKINGLGYYVWPDGRKYDGQWQENNMHGKGIYTSSNGTKRQKIYDKGECVQTINIS